MKSISGKNLCKIVEQRGWILFNRNISKLTIDAAALAALINKNVNKCKQTPQKT
jgi:hypothetical protein